MFDLPSFAISIAANIVYGFINSRLANVDKEIKAAYKAAEEKLFPDESLRDSVSIDRKLRSIKREIAQIINEPDKREAFPSDKYLKIENIERICFFYSTWFRYCGRICGTGY